MSEDGIISSSAEAAVVGFKAVKKVTGTLQPLVKKESRFMNEDEKGEKKQAKDQIEIALEDAMVLEMLDDQPIPELKDDKFIDWMPYADKGKDPSPQSGFTRGFCKSAEKIFEGRGTQEYTANAKGKQIPKYTWRDLVGQIVTLEKQLLSWTFNKGQANEETKSYLVWHFVEGEDSDVGLDDAIIGMVEGNTPQTAARNLMMDVRTKNNPELRNAAKMQQPIAGLEVIDGVYQKPVEEFAETV